LVAVSGLEHDVVLLDVLDPAFRPDSEQVAQARAAGWYARTTVGFVVLRYPQAAEVLADRRFVLPGAASLIARGVSSGPMYDWWTSIIVNVDGAAHARLRRLVGKAFTRRAVDALRGVMRAVAEELVDTFAATGECEFMADFADPYPVRIICELLGVPNDQQALQGWVDDLGLMFGPAVAEHRDRIEASLAALYHTVDDLIERRRARPGHGLLSDLITVEESGDRLSAQELRLLVSTMLFASQDTTRHQLGLAMTTFLAHPDQWRLLAEQPELATQAVEEVLRTAPVIPLSGRVAAEACTLHGLHIPAGARIHILINAANTDPAVFGQTTFDITATRPAPQLTFGGGSSHHCLGAFLARTELAEALPILARGLCDPRLAGTPQWRPPVGVTGPVTLPLRFTPTRQPFET